MALLWTQWSHSSSWGTTICNTIKYDANISNVINKAQHRMFFLRLLGLTCQHVTAVHGLTTSSIKPLSFLKTAGCHLKSWEVSVLQPVLHQRHVRMAEQRKGQRKRWLQALSGQTSTYLTSYPLEDSSGASAQHHLPQQQFFSIYNHRPQSSLLSLQTPSSHELKPTSMHVLTNPFDLHM